MAVNVTARTKIKEQLSQPYTPSQEDFTIQREILPV